ncbi:hypothetical protein [Bradyrhizobium elkanii]|jgi:hypothetical protein|uniref:hypothetical protein n=1 Tax=Bradyrhizobium elkanii TaxID=29448 RepID=UPI0021673CBC|nr:hypothetical protein [Bradyrhizobium elkanii]MCS3519299.1 hypothetical protein [Bradyrhizobium elkanii]MCS4066956.1 hypothetical protein [Bradyrhizobium elkanii]MCS4082491.1 hypothetical protein [Bradyrhizobium elkanii]MCW2127890.1 hypothetical protein [Bradyrhizobium elkanii]MCW2174633.1 hypothetical protein [Bradyrhizobium elkanii]
MKTEYIRRLHIVDDGRLNVAELKVFVLGGAVQEGEPCPIFRGAQAFSSTTQCIEVGFRRPRVVGALSQPAVTVLIS